MNERTPCRHALTRHVFVLTALCTGVLSSCAGTGSSFGMTRGASNEGRRALDIDCVGAFSFSPDGRYMASSDGRTLRVRKSPSGRPHETFDVREAQGDGGTSVSFSPDSRWLAASVNGDTAVKVFDTADWKEHANYLVDSGRVGAIAFSSDGAELAIGTSSSMIELLNLAGGGRRVLRKARGATAQDSTAISFLAYGAGDRTLLANAGGDVISIDRAQGDVLWSRPEERVLALAPDGRRLIAVSIETGLARLYDLTTSNEPGLLCTIHDPAAPSVAETAVFAADGAWIGVGFARHFVGTHWQELEFYRLTPESGGNTASGGAGEKLRAEQIRSLRAGEPRRMTVSPDGKLLCLCTVPIAAIYELGYLLPKDRL